MVRILFSLLLIAGFSANINAQEINRVTMDEKSQTEILIGACDRDGLMLGEFGTSYMEEFALYSPNDSIMGLLGNRLDDIGITIVLGAWCGDSKEQVPRFIKILEQLNYDIEQVTMIAVDRTKTAGEFPMGELQIERVPTFFFYRAGEEIGRIIETPEVSLEGDLLRIVNP